MQIGTSTSADASEAVGAAVREALAGVASPVLALVFCTCEYSPAAVAQALRDELRDVPFAGMLANAIVVSGRIMPRGVAVGILDGAAIRVGVGIADAGQLGAREAGARAMRASLSDLPFPPADRSRAVLLLTDTSECDAAEVVSGALRVAGAGVAWCGGGAGPGGGHPATLYAHGQALTRHVLAVTIDFQARVGAGIQHGWAPSGSPATVTRAKGTVVLQLEHLPAFEIYRGAAAARGKEIQPDTFAEFALTHPLGIPQAAGEYLIRDPISVDPAAAIHFLAGVPDGALLRVMEGTTDMLIEAARAAATQAREDAESELAGALVFDCVSRQSVLGDALRAEIAACQSVLGDDVPLLGCLSFGEIGAFGGRVPQFHNKTIVVLAIPK